MPTVFPPTGAQGFTATSVFCAVAVIFDKVHTHHLLPIDPFALQASSSVSL